MNRVVIVDDNIFLVEQIVNALKNYQQIKVVGTANNGNIAEKLIKELKPDIVVIDIKMPRINTIEFLEKVTKLEKDNIPQFIIISTPIEDRNIIDKLLDLSIRKIIPKPFKIEKLINAIVETERNNNNNIRIIIADDDKYCCNKIKNALNKFEDIEILGIANTDSDELRMIKELKPDIVITDLIRNNEFTGLDIIKESSIKNRNLKFFVISYAPESTLFMEYENVKGYIHKYPGSNYEKVIWELRRIKRDIIEENDNKIRIGRRCNTDFKNNNFLSKIKCFFISK